MKTLQFLNFAGKDQKETISESEVNKWEFETHKIMSDYCSP